MMILSPSLAHPGHHILYVSILGHQPSSLQPWLLAGPATLVSNSRISLPKMARKLVPEIATAHGKFISTGIVGPCSQLLLPARRSSVVDPVDDPPMMKTALSRVTAACPDLFCSNDPILFSSHWPVLASKTRQEESELRSPSLPPQVATTGSSPAVRKVVW